MDVTRSNFYALLPSIKEAIEKSDFISIDCELTGLNTGLKLNAYDIPRQYYEKVRKGAKDFLIIQYGLCIFRYDKTLKVFKQQGYNFYVFPRPSNKLMPDHRFLCQASSIEFLIKQGFDFNKVFKEGIPYLNTVEEDKYKKTLLEKQGIRAAQLQNSFSPQSDKSSTLVMSVEDKAVVDDIFNQVEAFIASDKEEVILPLCNAYIRRLVYREATKRLGNRASLETRLVDDKDRVFVAMRFKSKTEREKQEKQRLEDEEEEMKRFIGFSEVIKSIVASGKLLIGHNMCLDIFHTIDKFLTPLPEDYEEFKELTHYSFSNVLDTKHMSSATPFKELIKSNVLAHLLQTIKEAPFVIPSIEIEDNRQGYILNASKEHEAGYDAYITGLSFLAMWNHLGNSEKTDDPFSNFSLLEPYTNRLFLMRIYDAPYIRLGGNDPILHRDHVLYIAFPKDWKLNDIIQLFSPFGNVNVAWIDESSAYVGLYKREQAAIALSTLSQSDTYTVMSYAKRQAQLAGRTLMATTSPLVCRKRSLDSTTVKKRRTTSFGESNAPKRKRSIDPIVEDPEELPQINTDVDIGMPLRRADIPKLTSPKSTVRKTFEEISEWD